MANLNATEAPTNRRLAHGALAMGVGNVVRIAVQLAVLPVMARLLGPAEFGLYGLALPTITLLLMLADGGLGASLAREALSSRLVWSSAFWALLIGCCLMALGVIGWSFVLAKAAGQPRLPALMSALAICLPLMALSILPDVRLLRQGRLGLGSLADLSASLIGAGLGVAAAMRGAGAWSLVIQQVAGHVARTGVLYVAAPVLPRLEMSLRAVRPHLVIGVYALGARISEFAGRIVENASISRFLGPASLGAYTIANQAPRLVCEGAGNPAWATLYVRALGDDADSVSRAYLRLTRLLALGLFPATFIAGAAADDWVRVILGPSWSSAGPLLAFLLPSHAVAVVTSQGGAILVARGRTDVQMWLTGGWAAGRVVATLAAPIIGLGGVVIGVAAMNLLYGAASATLLARFIGVRAGALFRCIATPLFAAGVAALTQLWLIQEDDISLVRLAAYQAGGLVLYAALVLTVEGRRTWDEVRAALAVVVRRERS